MTNFFLSHSYAPLCNGFLDSTLALVGTIVATPFAASKKKISALLFLTLNITKQVNLHHDKTDPDPQN
jgi:hypothetical protein